MDNEVAPQTPFLQLLAINLRESENREGGENEKQALINVGILLKY